MFCVFVFFFSDFLSKSIYCASTIQMGTHNICLYKEIDKKYTGCNTKTTELLDCALIGVCAIIRSNTVLKLIYACGFLHPRTWTDPYCVLKDFLK